MCGYDQCALRYPSGTAVSAPPPSPGRREETGAVCITDITRTGNWRWRGHRPRQHMDAIVVVAKRCRPPFGTTRRPTAYKLPHSLPGYPSYVLRNHRFPLTPEATSRSLSHDCRRAEYFSDVSTDSRHAAFFCTLECQETSRIRCNVVFTEQPIRRAGGRDRTE